MLNYEEIKESLIFDISSEARLVELVQRLSQQFTTTRENIGEYWESPELTAAYALFYFPTNYAKFAWAMEKIKKDFVTSSLEVIDMGSGPGTFLQAFKDHFPEVDNFIGIEHSKVMREQAKLLWAKAYQNEKECLFVPSAEKLPAKKSQRLLLFGHSLNEMEDEFFQKTLKTVDPDFILFIEPGTKQSFSKIKMVREFLLQKKFQIFYPCPSAAACPMDNTDNWCHQYVMASFEAAVERLCQLVKLDRRHMPVIMHFYAKDLRSQIFSENEARIVQTFPETKFSVEWEVCRNHVKNKIEHLQLLKRKLSKSETKELKKLYAGDTLSFEIEKEISESNLRLKKVSPLT